MTERTYSNAISMISENFSIIGPDRLELADTVVRLFAESDDPLDVLGVAFAYMWKGARSRGAAISCFERFLKAPAPIPCRQISEWGVHSYLATLYEREYLYDKAIEQLRICIRLSNGSNPADYTRIGDILVKKDLAEAEDYYIRLLNDPKLKRHERPFAYALNEITEKKARGYVYRPRGKDRP